VRAPATERALGVEGGVWLCTNEQSGETLWPRCLYPSADDAVEANWDLWNEDGWFEEKVRLTWAVQDHREFGWWRWGDEFRDSWEAVECWVVEP
jgi:hypothetical protein